MWAVRRDVVPRLGPAMTALEPGDRYLQVNPYFHMFGLKSGILTSVAAGVTMLPEPVFDVGRALQRVAEEQVTVFPGTPTLYQSILDYPIVTATTSPAFESGRSGPQTSPSS